MFKEIMRMKLNFVYSRFDPNELRFDLKVKILEPLNLHGEYKIEGKVLVLPIVGNDICNLTLGE